LKDQPIDQDNKETDLFLESGIFFARNSASIEVIRNGELERIVFYKVSFCNHLKKNIK
jgi:hypothetical protein